MKSHAFIFTPGIWIGEGKISFSASSEEIKFYTHWTIESQKNHQIIGEQRVELHGMEENVSNHFVFRDISPKGFFVELENELIGKAIGKGVIDEHTIAWELHGPDNFEGFEVYEAQENGEYLLRAEYTSDDQYRTIIEGRIWKKG